MESLLQDVRYGLRAARRNPAFTLVVLLTLAIGIGANTALFSIVDAVLLRPLPYTEPSQLVAIHDDIPGANLQDAGMSVQELDDLNRSGIFEHVSAVIPIDANVTGREKPERIEGLGVSPNYFELLGARAALGRVFQPSDYRHGLFEGVVISDGLWRRMFGGDPTVVGQVVRLDSDAYTIIGVMPPDFRHPGHTLRSEVEVWICGGYIAPPFPQPPQRAIRLFPGAIARIKPGTMAHAQARLDAFVAELRRQYPTEYPESARWTVRLAPLHQEVVGTAGTMLLVLWAAVSVVLLIACVNIASLLLARSSVRHREIALRQALGAGAGRLARQMLTESGVLALGGGVLALVLTFSLNGLLVQAVPSTLPRLQEVAINSRVLLVALGISLATGLAFGLAPALQSADRGLINELRTGGRGGALGLRQHRFLSGLVIAEFALSLVLLVGAGLLLRSFWKVLQVQPGFDTSHLVMAHVWLPLPNDPRLNPYLTQEKRAVFVREVLRRVSRLPGVQSAAIGSANTPFSGQRALVNFTIDGHTTSQNELPGAEFGSLTPDFSRTLGMRLVRGRSFTDADTESGNPVVLVDQTAVERYWPNRDPIGTRILLSMPGALEPPRWATIVGILGRTRSEGLDAPYAAHMFFPSYQNVSSSMTIYLRTAASAESLQHLIRGAVQSVDPELPVFGVRTIEDLVSDSLASRRFALRLMALFAATALLLAAIGIYGVMAYVVSQRTREIGIRLALGAQRGDVLKMVVWQGMSLALIGVLAGVGASSVAATLLSGLLFGVSPRDPLTTIAFAALLGTVALAANYIPAYRATKIDPMLTLKHD